MYIPEGTLGDSALLLAAMASQLIQPGFWAEKAAAEHPSWLTVLMQ